MICSNCGYEWDSSSKLQKVTCPSCGYKTVNSKPLENLLRGRVKTF